MSVAITFQVPSEDTIAGTTFPGFGTTVGVWTTAPELLPRLDRALRQWVALVEAACSRFRADSEVALLPDDGTPARVSPLLAELVQTALLAARLTDARAAGCDVAVITTQPGSTSQQNAQRRGFDLLYTRATLLKHP